MCLGDVSKTGLNALTGIQCIRSKAYIFMVIFSTIKVLMPLRAFSVFVAYNKDSSSIHTEWSVLMPLRAFSVFVVVLPFDPCPLHG